MHEGFFLFSEVFTLSILQKNLHSHMTETGIKTFPLLFTINYAKYIIIGGMTPGNSWPPKYDMDPIVIRDCYR